MVLGPAVTVRQIVACWYFSLRGDRGESNQDILTAVPWPFQRIIKLLCFFIFLFHSCLLCVALLLIIFYFFREVNIICWKALVSLIFFSFRAVGSEYVKFVFSLCLLIAVRGRGCFYIYYGLHHVVGDCSEVFKFSSAWGLWLEFGCSLCLPCSELWRWPFPVSASQYGLRFWALPALVVLKLDIVHVFPDLMSVDQKKLNSSSVRKSGKQVNVLSET